MIDLTNPLATDLIVFDLSFGIASTGTTKHWLNYAPYAYTIENLILTSSVAPTGSTLIADLNVNGTSILATKISIDISELNSTTAATPYVLTTNTISKGSRITVDLDQVGATVAGSDVQLLMFVTRAT